MRARGIQEALSVPLAADLDHANPASSIRGKMLRVTYRGNMNPELTSPFEDGAPFLNGDRVSIYG
jgi:hypothetical protein